MNLNARYLSYAAILMGIILIASTIPVSDKSDVIVRTTIKLPLAGSLSLHFVEITLSPHTLVHLPGATEMTDFVGGLVPDAPALPFSTGELIMENIVGGIPASKPIGKINQGFSRVTTLVISNTYPDTLKLNLYEDSKLKITKEIVLT